VRAPPRNFAARPELSGLVRSRRFAVLIGLGVALACPGAALAARTVPYGWVGAAVTDGTLLSSDSLLASETLNMRSAGVESIRVPVYWSQFQPYRRRSSVPAGLRERFSFLGRGRVPTDLSVTDNVVEQASRRGLRVLPAVLAAPRWAKGRNPYHEIVQPRGTRDYVNYLLTLVDRYGPHGTFWDAVQGVPYRPIRAWQIWNEPDHANFWRHRGHKWPVEYVRLVKAAHRALKRVDRGAKVVLGGLTGYSWYNLPKLYKAGLKGNYEELALHPYTRDVGNVVRTLELCRQVMRRYHDNGRPIRLTELSWPASRRRVRARDQLAFAVTEGQQAARLTDAYRVLARKRHKLNISGVDWFTWLSTYHGDNPWYYAGLRSIDYDGTVRAKPAYTAYRRVARRLEGR
jgi:hypothetical protein